MIIYFSTQHNIPKYQTDDAAGMDLSSSINVSILPMQRLLIPTGIRMAIPKGYEGQIRSRSGLALKYGITVLNAPGTIDADYRGEIKVMLINLSDCTYEITQGDRIAQLVISSYLKAKLMKVDILEDDTKRGSDGFGSTGK